MTESGINSFEEFLVFYLATGFLLGALWAVLESDVLIGPEAGIGTRRTRQLRIMRMLAPLGVVQPAFALIAMDASRRDDVMESADQRLRTRVAREARLCAVAEANQVVISHATYELVEPHVVADALPPMHLKGIEGNIGGWSVRELR